MAKRIKIEDLMNTFLVTGEETIKELESVKETLSKIEQLLNGFESAKINFNLEPIERFYKEMSDKNLELLKTLESTHVSYEKKFKGIINEHLEKLKKVEQKKFKNELYTYIPFLLYLIFTTGVLTYGTKQHYKRINVEEVNETYLKEIKAKNLFLKESELEDNFEEWLDGKIE